MPDKDHSLEAILTIIVRYLLFKWKSLLFSSNFHSFSCQKYPFPKINRGFWARYTLEIFEGL